METFIKTSYGMALWARQDGKTSDPAIVLIPGANASAFMWPDELVQLFVDRGFSVIRYDPRDTGKSTKVDFSVNPYSVETLAEDVVAVLDGLGLKRAHVVGLSQGGTLVQVLLLEHPKRLLTTTITMTAALDVDFVGNIGRAYQGEKQFEGLPVPSLNVLQQLEKRATPTSSEEEELRRRFEEWLALTGSKAKTDEAEFRKWELRVIRHAGTWRQPTNHAFATPVATSRGVELKKVQVPTLVIQAGQDPLNPPPHGKHLAGLIPTATLVEIEEMGHSLPSSIHNQFVELILEHIKSNASS